MGTGLGGWCKGVLGRVGSLKGRNCWLMAALGSAASAHAQLSAPATAPATGPTAPVSRPAPAQSTDDVIVPVQELEAALPPITADASAPMEPIGEAMRAPLPSQGGPAPAAAAPQVGDAIPPVGPEDPALAAPLDPLASFNTTPLVAAGEAASGDAPEIRYDTRVVGLDAVKLEDEWKGLSALREGDGKAANAAQVSARAREDEALAVRLMRSLGYYDGTAVASVETVPGAQPNDRSRLRATVSATPGRLYRLAGVAIQAGPTLPADLLRRELPLKTGDPIEAARIQGAEANVQLRLPQQGYPFVQVGERDVLLDDAAATGDYTLPVDTGPRSSFGRLVAAGDPVFGPDHLNLFPRFKQGQLYDSRMVDDLRDALVGTALFGTVSVAPQRTGRAGPDGTEEVDLLVRQSKGKWRSLAGQGGYSTGQGVRLEGTWTHRNLFPDEGALIASVVAGTQEQGVSGTFRRSNAGRRDRTFTAVASVLRSDYDAFNSVAATLSARWSYDSTPIWQKRLTYYYGGELVGTNESVYDFARGERRRGTYFIAALPGQVQFDTSDNLLNPTRGYRITLNLSPETSVRGAVRPYVRSMAEGTYYHPVSDSLVIAGRARAGSIAGVARNDLAPSRRYYGGGGGSVRGYGFQRLGPFDPDGNPVGGRSLNEFALEARYRFGNFGIVPFIDAGNSYESTMPRFSDLRFGAGIGGRFYTNFGPLRADIATPLNRRPGDGRVALYISIGQAF